MTTNSALAGQQAAEKESYAGWLVLGTLVGPVAPFFAHVLTPTTPSSVLQAGPSESTEQHVFMDAYVGRAKNLRIRQAWIGLVFSFFFYTAACVGGCITFVETTLDWMLRNPPGQTGRVPASETPAETLNVREPGDPGPRPVGVWTGNGGSTSAELVARWRDPRAAESWTVTITFGNNRIEVSYPTLGCSGELIPVHESARQHQYAESLTCVSTGYIVTRRTPNLLLQRTSDNHLWFEWSQYAGPVLATASLRPISR